MDNIAVLLVLATIGLAWWSAIGARNAARNAALKACKRAGVSFIDELAFRKLSVGRNVRGMMCLKRRYEFEFYVRGNLRYGGWVDMSARRVASVQMDPYPEASPEFNE